MNSRLCSANAECKHASLGERSLRGDVACLHGGQAAVAADCVDVHATDAAVAADSAHAASATHAAASAHAVAPSPTAHAPIADEEAR